MEFNRITWWKEDHDLCTVHHKSCVVLLAHLRPQYPNTKEQTKPSQHNWFKHKVNPATIYTTCISRAQNSLWCILHDVLTPGLCLYKHEAIPSSWDFFSRTWIGEETAAHLRLHSNLVPDPPQLPASPLTMTSPVTSRKQTQMLWGHLLSSSAQQVKVQVLTKGGHRTDCRGTFMVRT